MPAASGPTAATRPVNSWPMIVGPWCPLNGCGAAIGKNFGACANSEASVPQIAARVTSSTTSEPSGSAGSGMSSTRTSPGAW